MASSVLSSNGMFAPPRLSTSPSPCSRILPTPQLLTLSSHSALTAAAAVSCRRRRGLTGEIRAAKVTTGAGITYVPVYVMLPLGTINMNCEVVNAEDLKTQLQALKSINVDGVMIDCWWGVVEKDFPLQYNWSGYNNLFKIVRDLGLKLQVVMSFHQCGGNVGDNVYIPLPEWVKEIGMENPDIFFTDREGRRNTECLSFGVDDQRVMRGRTAAEVYFDLMTSFRQEFAELLEDGTIAEVEIGLGPCGELRYPSYPANHGWIYPGIGEFQCYDKYLMRSLKTRAEAVGRPDWFKAPENAGSYNSKPHETGFFCVKGDFNDHYGRFFLNWYSGILVDHADRVLKVASSVFKGTPIAAKVSGVHWWYESKSHAAELTAGFYSGNPYVRYAPIMMVLGKYGAALNFTCVELRTEEQLPEAFSNPEGLVWQVLNLAWDLGLKVASENALPCYHRSAYDKILQVARPIGIADERCLAAFTYLRLTPELIEESNLLEFRRFVDLMHGV